MARRVVNVLAIQGASIIRQPGGRSVPLTLGTGQKPFGMQRSDKPRTWRSLDRCVDYLKNELHLSRFGLMDATLHSGMPTLCKPRSDAAEQLRQTHQAAAYDKWFRAKVVLDVQEADNPATVWLDNSAVMAASAERRAQWLKRAQSLGGQTNCTYAGYPRRSTTGGSSWNTSRKITL